MPANTQELERQVGVRLVVSDRTDPEEVGYVQWRTAFYVAGRPKRWLRYRSSFVVVRVCISFRTMRRLDKLSALARRLVQLYREGHGSRATVCSEEEHVHSVSFIISLESWGGYLPRFEVHLIPHVSVEISPVWDDG